MPTKGRKSEERTRKRAQEVIDAATKVFYERGYATATVQDVADELGILKGSVYHYIDTKEDLLFRLLVTVHEDVAQVLETVSNEPGLDVLERLELYVRRQVEYNLANLARISVYHHDFERLGDERRAEVVKAREVHQGYVVALIKEAQGAGLADDTREARLLANCLFGTIIWPYRWFAPGRWSHAVVAEQCAIYAMQGLRPAPAA